MSYITEGLKHQFAKNIELVAQEKGKLRKYVTEEEQETETAHFETMEEIDAYPRDRVANSNMGGYGTYLDPANPVLADTKLSFPNITRRQLNCQAWAWSATLDRNDKLNLLADPTSKFPQLAGLAIGRAMDKQIIKAVASPVMSGLTGQSSINFNIANNVVPLGLLNAAGDAVGLINDKTALAFQIDPAIASPNGSTAIVARYKAAGLTVDKLLMAKHKLNKGTSNSDEKKYFVCSQQQLTDLLQDPRVTSYDYNNVRALVNGEVKTFMGFEFIISELLTGIAPLRRRQEPIPVGAHSIRECFAFVESSIRFATVKNSQITRAEELFMKHSAPAVYHSMSFGAARVNEGGVVVVKCLEPTGSDHVADNGWIQPEMAADNIDQRKARLTRASVIPSNSLAVWNQKSFANDNVLANLIDENTSNDMLLEIAKKKQ